MYFQYFLLITFDCQMNANHKFKALLFSCFFIVATLFLIQFYLVQNTYRLTRDKYHAEVKAALNKISSAPATDEFEDKFSRNLKQCATLYAARQLSKQAFLRNLATRNDSVTKAANRYFTSIISNNLRLKDVHYQAQYIEVVLNVNGREDTLLGQRNQPYIYIGKGSGTTHTLLLNRENTQNINHQNKRTSGKSSQQTSFIIHVKSAQFADVSAWKQEVFKRMAGILLLAIGLIIAVIVLFFLVFRAMLRQKKIAEIRTDFANNITHELKTPLSSVGLILKSLERPEVQGNTVLFKNLLQSLNRQQAKIQHTVDSVLESAMLTQVKVELAETDITSFLIYYVKDTALFPHSFSAEIEPGQKSIKTHLPTLEKALNNLIENAIKYSPEASDVVLKAYAKGVNYIIEIIDKGSGIALEHQSQVFEKFYRIPEQNRHTVKGLGLGLYISKQAVFSLGGSLTLISKCGKGSTFTIELPGR